MKLVDINEVVKLVDKHTLDDGSLDNDITCILEEIPFTYNMDVINELLDGKWVDSEQVQNALGFSFEKCLSKFNSSREAAWCSVVGETEEERQRNGQKVSIFFRVKTYSNDPQKDNCANCSRTKWYQEGYVDGQKENFNMDMVIDQIEDYGKYKGVLMCEEDGCENYIPVSVARQIVKTKGLGGVLWYMEVDK